jgi:radical SAM protein with 4Fe4S-binding SPASM domain
MLNNKIFQPKLILNRFKSVKSYLGKDIVVGCFPLELAIEITNRCNADCIMCSRRNMNRPIGDMELGLFKRIIDEAKTYTELIWMHLAGEPLLHPQLFEMIAYAKSKGVKLGLSTNAISLNKANALGIINSGLDLLIISFDGATKETYEKIRRLSNYQQTLNNILQYLNLKRKIKIGSPHTQIQFVYMQENKNEAKKFMRMWRLTAADAIRFKPYFKFPDVDSNHETMTRDFGYRRKKACYLLWRQCSIYWDGTVVSCCWDFLKQTPLGNLKTDSLKEIWNSPPMQLLRDKHLGGRYREIGLCKNCNVPQIRLPYLLGSIFIDDLTIKKILPFFDNLSNVNKIKGLRYYS